MGLHDSQRPGYITQIEGNMDQHHYKPILETEFEDTIEFYNFNKDEIIFNTTMTGSTLPKQSKNG